MLTTREATAQSLYAFVRAVAGSPVFRRALRYSPAEALAEASFVAPSVPDQLPVRAYELDVFIDEAHLFGPPVARIPTGALASTALRLVVAGAKPMALVHGPEAALAGLAAQATSEGLAALLSPHEFTPGADSGKGGFANLALDRRPARAGSGAWRGLLVGADWNGVALGWLCLLFGWDSLLGTLLGYPPCCVASFDRRWALASRKFQGDLISLLFAEGARGAVVEGQPWQTNLVARYAGHELIQHFPCRLDCPATHELALRYVSALRVVDPALVEALQTALLASVVYTEREGVCAFPGARVRDCGDAVELAYNPAAAQSPDPGAPLARAVAAARTLRADRKACTIRLGDRVVDGWLILFN